MINWVAVLRRMLKLYAVKTRGELGMALGIPLNFTLDGTGGESAIPWPVLEVVVAEKHVNWDWLLTGRGEQGAPRADGEEDDGGAARRAAERAAHAASAPRFETRDLARVLLNPQPAPAGGTDDAGTAAPDPSETARLSSIKTRLREEITRVESLLDNRSH